MFAPTLEFAGHDTLQVAPPSLRVGGLALAVGGVALTPKNVHARRRLLWLVLLLKQVCGVFVSAPAASRSN